VASEELEAAMYSHPDILLDIVHQRQADLIAEAAERVRAHEVRRSLSGRSAAGLAGAHRTGRRPAARRTSAGTLATCVPGAAE
jgi:hypothetical protein